MITIITGEEYVESMMAIKKAWGDGILGAICMLEHKPEMSLNEFLSHCVACGGNWGAMLLSGVRELHPIIWEMLPDKLGKNGNDAFVNICHLLILLNVDTSGDD